MREPLAGFKELLIYDMLSSKEDTKQMAGKELRDEDRALHRLV